MSHRYTRTDKGKWQDDRLPPRKPLVRIPESNVSELIESNKFTLIVDKARLRVRINGLKPLIMRMDIEIPSKEVMEVELEYEKLEKHCFHCKSLSHEDGECHYQSPARLANGERRHTNAAQQTTLERIEEGKKRQAERKHSRMQHSHYHEGARWTNYKTSKAREYRPISHGTSSKNSSGSSSVYEENRRRYDDRNLPSAMIPSHTRKLPMRGSQERAPAPHDWQSRNLPAPEPRGSRNSQSSPASSNPKGTLPSALGEVHQRSNIASRLSDPRNSMASSEECLPAKERLSVHTQRTNSKDQRVSSNDSSQDRLPALKRLSCQNQRSGSKESGEPHSNTQRVQEIETHCLEDTLPPISNGIIVTRPSSSNLFVSGRLGPGKKVSYQNSQ
ncbi:hypothetical protein DY000_02042305 [Brassica cretica]|uniref:Zinc knuckle CX2CX4HX4C domain-containing protein n=1 Tax=Brassica cretica TaxID=69181 RepID=A0ABQ7BKG9_BRACR|nr:hypothetical protein DY000_02042305 [Brassica cretica]